MNVSRRSLLASSAAAGAAALAGGIAPALGQGGSVAVGSLHDLSGAVDVYGVPSHMCMKFAIDEINAAGGLLGKRIDLKVYDAQSDIKKYPQYAQQAALQDKVVMLQGAITGALCGNRGAFPIGGWHRSRRTRAVSWPGRPGRREPLRAQLGR